MVNTGRKIFQNLQQIFVDTGLPTGIIKVNDPDDPDYVLPVVDNTTCPPPVNPNIIFNKLRCVIANQTDQVVVLQNVVIRPKAILDLTDAYYQNASLSILPNTTVTLFVGKNQVDEFTQVEFRVHALSKGNAILTDFKYKTSTTPSFTTLYQQSFGLSDVFSRGLFTEKVPASTDQNDLRIEIAPGAPLPSPNTPPVVNAGPDQGITLPNPLTLTGSASDSDGTVVSTIWSQVSGPSASIITSPASLTTTVTNLVPGVYVFQLSATDDDGAISTDTVQVVVSPAIASPNGIVNMFVESAIADVGVTIQQVTLISAFGAETNLLLSPINKDSGTVIATPLKGTYTMRITLGGSISGQYGLRVQFNGLDPVTLNPPAAGAYVINNVVVNEGVLGTSILLQANPIPSPSLNIVYAKLLPTTGLNLQSFNTLPNGLRTIGFEESIVEFHSNAIGTSPIPFTGILNYRIQTTDLLLSQTFETKFADQVNAQSSVTIGTITSLEEWDYTLNDPNVAETNDKITDQQYVYSLLPGQGYLIIP